MRIDAYTHFMPKKFFEKLVASGTADISKRMQEVPAIHDMDVRNRIVDSFPDYAQILSYPMPPLETLAKPDEVEEYAKIVNDGFAEICAKDPKRYPGWVAQAPMASPDAGVREAERALKNGALGVQIYTNVNGKPLDRPEFEPFFAAMNKNRKPVWIHPVRNAKHPDYLDEPKSKYEIWWALGWSYETTLAMSRLVFSKTLDKYPDLKLIVHHFGGITAMLEGRIGPGWDQLGSRTSGEDLNALLKSLKKRPLDYFKQNFYADCATFNARGAALCGFDFFPMDRIVFASDCPFDPEKGPGYIRGGLEIIESMNFSKEQLAMIYHGNLEKITGVKLVK
jgi:aminocarboxymuconate-semialdehyde decarboxylase